MRATARLLCLLLAFVSASTLAAEPIKVGVLKFGTVNWELDTVKHHGLDADAGVAVEVVGLASKNATSVALQGGAADVIVTDWIWVSRQRQAGKRYVFVPYSMAVGGLLARPDAGIETVGDLSGKRLGVAGGPVDKSWLLLRAYGQKTLGMDLADQVEVSYVAPPLLNKLMMRGELDAGLNFWHWGARLRAAGMRDVIGTAEILPAVGVDQQVPLLGWVFDEDWAKANAATVEGFLAASYAAKRVLDTDDAEWQRLDGRTKAEDETGRAALRDAYRSGIPRSFGEAEIQAAREVFAVMASYGGDELTGGSKDLDPGTFWREFEIPTW